MHQKPELQGTEAGSDSRFSLAPKPELPGEGSSGAAFAEMEDRGRGAVPGNDHRTRNLGAAELGNTAENGSDPADVPLPPSPTTSNSPHPSTSAGPAPSAFNLFPTLGTISPAAAAVETDFEAQERRLRERRAMIAEQKRAAEEEQEQIDMEEKALQRRRAGEGTKPS